MSIPGDTVGNMSLPIQTAKDINIDPHIKMTTIDLVASQLGYMRGTVINNTGAGEQANQDKKPRSRSPLREGVSQNPRSQGSAMHWALVQAITNNGLGKAAAKTSHGKDFPYVEHPATVAPGIKDSTHYIKALIGWLEQIKEKHVGSQPAWFRQMPRSSRIGIIRENRTKLENIAIECYVGKFEKDYDVAANEGPVPLHVVSTSDDMHNRAYAYYPNPDHVLSQAQIDNRRCITDGKFGRIGRIIIHNVL